MNITNKQQCDLPGVNIDKEMLDKFCKDNNYIGWYEDVTLLLSFLVFYFYYFIFIFIFIYIFIFIFIYIFIFIFIHFTSIFLYPFPTTLLTMRSGTPHLHKTM